MTVKDILKFKIEIKTRYDFNSYYFSDSKLNKYCLDNLLSRYRIVFYGKYTGQVLKIKNCSINSPMKYHLEDKL